MKLEIFFDNFDQLARAPNAVAKIRELILSLAVRGKLVSQDPNDEPAARALERIDRAPRRAMRTRATGDSEGELPSELEPLFELPPGWEWAQFKRLPMQASVGIDRGRSMQGPDKAFGYFKMNNIRNSGGVDLSDLTRVDATSDEIEAFALADGDFLFNTRNSRELVGKTCVYRPPSDDPVLYNNILRVKFIDGFSPDFIGYWFRSPEGNTKLEKLKSNTTNVCAIYQGKLSGFPCPIPPLAEQMRIVAKVDELIALCDRLEAQKQERDTRHAALARASLARFAEAPTPANLDFLFHNTYTITPADLRKSILTLAVQGKLVPQDPNHELAEELYARIQSAKEQLIKTRTIKRVSVEPNPNEDSCDQLPTGWIWTRLGNVFDIRDGTHDTPKYTSEGFPLITSKHIYTGSLSFEGVNYISEEDHRQISERSRVDRRDILFAMIGSIGNPVIVDTDREFSIKNVALFKYYAPDDAEPRFLLLYLKLVSEEMRAKAAGGVQSFVSLGFLRNYPFPLPPLAEQRHIVAKVDQLMALVGQLETQLTASRATAAKLMQAVVVELTASAPPRRIKSAAAHRMNTLECAHEI